MNLFKNLGLRFKAQNQERKAAEGNGRKTEVRPAKDGDGFDKMPPPYLKSLVVAVPLGHVLPLGEKVTQPFNLIVEAGVRWHPEWEEARTTVNLYRILPQGDALGWSGDAALASFKTLLDADVVALAEYHGQPLTSRSRELLAKMGLTAPKAKQTYSSFNTFRQLHKGTGR